MTDYKQLCVELAALAKREHYYCEDSWYSCPKAADGCADDYQGSDCNCGADAHNAKVDALVAALTEPEPEGPTGEELLELYQGPGTFCAIEYARAVLARWGNHPVSPDSSMPQPAAGEVAGVAKWLHKRGRLADLGTRDWYFCAAELLERLSFPRPVPVSERMPGPGDCDAEGRCWLLGKVEGDWRLINPAKSGVPQLRYCFSHWLPAHALPLPS